MMHLSDTEFAQQFANCTLDPKLFTHEAHLRLAWIHVRRDGVSQAIENIRSQITAYDRKFGDGSKYHETITIAAIHVIDHFIRKSTSTRFSDFINEFPRLQTHFRDILAQHYTSDIFTDAEAKTTFVHPDRQPFDN
jgi:hypothetical protein